MMMMMVPTGKSLLVPITTLLVLLVGCDSTNLTQSNSTNRQLEALRKGYFTFKCTSSTTLISLEQVCDGIKHCPNGEDEGEGCKQLDGLIHPNRYVWLYYISSSVISFFFSAFLVRLTVTCFQVWHELKTIDEMSTEKPDLSRQVSEVQLTPTVSSRLTSFHTTVTWNRVDTLHDCSASAIQMEHSMDMITEPGPTSSTPRPSFARPNEPIIWTNETVACMSRIVRSTQPSQLTTLDADNMVKLRQLRQSELKIVPSGTKMCQYQTKVKTLPDSVANRQYSVNVEMDKSSDSVKVSSGPNKTITSLHHSTTAATLVDSEPTAIILSPRTVILPIKYKQLHDSQI